MIVMKEEKKSFEYRIWVWKKDFKYLLEKCAKVCAFELDRKEYYRILELIRNTNDELNNWVDYSMKGNYSRLEMRFAYDSEEGYDIVHLNLKGPQEIEEKINEEIRKY